MLWVLRQGTIPQNFAIVADGNRRFSRKKKISLSHVYSLMFRKFTTTWPYMAALGVPEVTYFIISTRNFSRNTRDLVTAIDEMMKFFARTLQCPDITAGFLADWLAVSEAPETELWFRSSGEMRFSEFLVLQSGYSYIHIDPQLWPAITSWNWIWAVLQFQLKWPYIKALKDSHGNLWASPQDRNGCASIIRQKSFLRRIKCAKMAYLSNQCFSEINQPTNASLLFSGNHLTE
ncbi:dehydrodolichyl diphosphate synthase complex subunit DHDDS-like [Rhipicephalus microplus]|uniref:dehydrodolichyl diphosphate synthase complex subunit DHDDS-like n=1 Tax=Rhipicephalus microplus TaxID=6941 RepID=UPI003F6BD2A7